MWCYLYRICLCTSITVSDVVTCVSPVIFGASQPVSVVSCSSLHVMLVLSYEFVPWSPCLPRSTESMPIVLSKTSLPCCAFFIPLFLIRTGHKNTRSSSLWGNREVGESLDVPAFPLTLSDMGSSLSDLHMFHPCTDRGGPSPSFISSLENLYPFYPRSQIRASI